MTIHHAIWTVEQKPAPLVRAMLPSEKALEDMIVAAPKILSDSWMLIGRQEETGHGGIIDLLATVPLDKAVSKIGLFGNQNTICRPTTPKWRITIKRLKTHFPEFEG